VIERTLGADGDKSELMGTPSRSFALGFCRAAICGVFADGMEADFPARLDGRGCEFADGVEQRELKREAGRKTVEIAADGFVQVLGFDVIERSQAMIKHHSLSTNEKDDLFDLSWLQQ